MSRTVTFGESCQYDSAPYNSEDVNKLFGLSFGFGGVHHNSARFGWRWSKADQCIELLAYVYNRGERNWNTQLRFPVVAQVPLGVQLDCRLLYMESNDAWNYARNGAQYVFTVTHPGGVDVAWVPAPAAIASYGLTHGLYFGGSQPAPHDIHVIIDRHGK